MANFYPSKISVQITNKLNQLPSDSKAKNSVTNINLGTEFVTYYPSFETPK